MGKTILYIIIALIIIGVVGYFVSMQFKSQEKKIAQLNKEIEWLKKETIPIRYKVKSRQDEKVELLVKFYDLEGKEIKKADFELEGNQPSFDFYVVKFEQGYIAIPWKIFTEKIKPEDGILLWQYYEKDNFPMIFATKQKNKAFKEGIEALYKEIKTGNLEKYNVFGSMVQNTNADIINNRDIDVWYKIIVHTKGGLEIQQE